MSRWGQNSFQEDDAMDRVGDVWRDIFKDLRKDVVCSIISPHFQKSDSAPLSLMLWVACETELSNQQLNRIGCLLTTDITVAKSFVAKLNLVIFHNALRKMRDASPAQSKLSAAAAISFFCSKLNCKLENGLTEFAIEHISSLADNTTDFGTQHALHTELDKLREPI